jgi:hypothetical protein
MLYVYTQKIFSLCMHWQTSQKQTHFNCKDKIEYEAIIPMLVSVFSYQY